MGSPKANLDWHGSTLLRRVTGIIARCVDGPVVVVSAAGQQLPELDPAVEVVEDAREYRGPLQGLAGGLEAVDGRAAVAYVSSTDLPLLHPAFVRRVVSSLSDRWDVVLPEVGGHRQPLAAAYRTELLGLVQELVAADRLRPAFLFERCRVLTLSDRQLSGDPELALLDPSLDSLSNLNEPADYQRALALAAPEVSVQRLGTLQTARAWSLGELAAAIGFAPDDPLRAAVNGDPPSSDRQLPLAAGDTVAFMAADEAG